jgi:hypothetical protein
LKIFQPALGRIVVEPKSHRYYTFNDMGTEEFPELLNEIWQ